MRHIVTERVAWSVCLSVTVSPAKTAELIEIPFRIGTRMGPMKHVDDRAQWYHLLNIIKPSMCGGDAAFCQITL